MRIINLIFQVICYYVAWFAAIGYAAHKEPWKATLVVILLSALQLLWQYRVMKRTKALWFLLVMFSLLGFVVDSLLQYYHLIVFPANPFTHYSPPWMVMIWFNFGILFYSVLKGYAKRYKLMSVLSLIFFPVAYVIGAKLGAAYFPLGYWSSIFIGMIWCLLFPLCLLVFNIYEGKHG